MTQWLTAAGAFVDAGGTLFPIMNPIGCAVLFPQMSRGLTQRERAGLARRIALNAGLALLVAIYAGASLLSFFGISLGALRIAGGLVVATQAWHMLAETKDNIHSADANASAFVPFTIPFTTGPGTLAAAIALGSVHPVAWTDFFAYFLGLSAAAFALAAMVAILYGSAERIAAWLGPARAQILARLSAFMLLCIGIEILVRGAHEAWH